MQTILTLSVILVEVIILLDITFLSWKKMHGPSSSSVMGPLCGT